jgi:hypothetical protein
MLDIRPHTFITNDEWRIKVGNNREHINKQIPDIGVIRWDIWYPQEGDKNTNPDALTLSNPRWHDRIPFYGEIHPDGIVTGSANSQEIMDQEISYAKEAGIKYWAFINVPDNDTDYSTENRGLRLYLSSEKKGDIDFCVISHKYDSDIEPWAYRIKRYVDYFKEPSYYKVLDGRPLFIVFDADMMKDDVGSEKEVISYLQDLADETRKSGMKAPYFVEMSGDPSVIDKYPVFDAISRYATFANDPTNIRLPFRNFSENNKNDWSRLKASGKKIIPNVTVGWDGEPRYLVPPPWGVGAADTQWYEKATTEEIIDLVESVFDWVRKNPDSVEVNSIIIYAWNEFAEGGWLCPTLNQDGGIDTSRINALKNFLEKM